TGPHTDDGGAVQVQHGSTWHSASQPSPVVPLPSTQPQRIPITVDGEMVVGDSVMNKTPAFASCPSADTSPSTSSSLAPEAPPDTCSRLAASSVPVSG